MGRHSSYTSLICIEAREKQKKIIDAEVKTKKLLKTKRCVYFSRNLFDVERKGPLSEYACDLNT